MKLSTRYFIVAQEDREYVARFEKNLVSEKIQNNSNIRIYPNPAANQLTIENASGKTVEIFTIRQENLSPAIIQ